MAVVYDKASGRLVRETDEERRLRESQKRQGITTTTTAPKTTTTSAPARPEGQGQPATPTGASGAARSAEAARATAMAKEYGKRPVRYIPSKKGFPTTEAAPTVSGRTSSVTASDSAKGRNLFDALTELEAATRGGSASTLESIRGLYAPQLSEAETARLGELSQLEKLLGQSRGTIDAATAAYLESLTPTKAFENIPLVALQAEQNPLLAALASQGAGTQEIESQRALDTALANQMKALSERSAAQYGATESAYVDALRRMAAGAQAAGQQSLAQRGVELGAGITSRYQDLANQLKTAQLEAETEVNRNLQEQLAKIAEERAKVVGEYGPPKEVKPKRTQLPKVGGPKKPVTRTAMVD